MTNVKDSQHVMVEDILLNAMLMTDGYKLGHHCMYPKGMTQLFSNFTPRGNKYLPEANEGVVVFGIQYFIKKYLINTFNNFFFNLDEDTVRKTYTDLTTSFLGEAVAKKVGVDHIIALHRLGYLPIRIKALPEGSYCPIGCPVLTITNTHPDFAWLTNYLESILSNILWQPMTSATISDVYRRELVRHAMKTGFYNPNDLSNLDFLCHDFSMRGMSSLETTITSGMAHLTSFCGSESVPAIKMIEYYYKADPKKELIAATVPATEHSVECSNATNDSGIPDDEIYFKRMLDEFPDDIISIVADGYDYWYFITKIVPKYKEQIMSRNGRVVIRPDSGDPVKIICGDSEANDQFVKMGSYEFLWNTFGGTFNKKGYKVLDTHIGLLYGDSINMKRQRMIYAQLEDKMFAATNLILGIGSFSFQMNTRDQLAFACKATWCSVNGKSIEIFKDPKTVTGTPKKSHRGLIMVVKDENGNYKPIDRVSIEDEASDKNELKTVFEDGKLVKEFTLAEIRKTRQDAVHKLLDGTID